MEHWNPGLLHLSPLVWIGLFQNIWYQSISRFAKESYLKWWRNPRKGSRLRMLTVWNLPKWSNNTYIKYFQHFQYYSQLKVDSHLPKNCFICFNEGPLKIMENVFYFTLKALLVSKMFNFFSWIFVHVEKPID